jgi:hypothetical protein
MQPQIRTMFIRPDNFYYNNNKYSTTRIFYASSGSDLHKQIIESYKLVTHGKNIDVQIWSHQRGMGMPRYRLDTLDELPKNQEDGWVYLATLPTV